MKKRKNFYWGNADPDYVVYLNHNVFLSCDSEDVLSAENDDDIDDPEYTLFFHRLVEDGSSYILQADERIGLKKSFKYEEDESNDVDQEDDIDKDEDYEFYWKNLKITPHGLIFHHEGYLPVMYDCKVLETPSKDNNHDHPSSSKKISEPNIHCKESSSSSGEDKYTQQGNMKNRKCSKFRDKIMRILRRPYDKEEHTNLLHHITLKKPQDRHFDLRSGGVRFTEGKKLGKSYLDHHGDLKRMVQTAAKDENKQLNLLRGYFFWIQNLTQEGSFMPWKDKECLALAAQPES